MGHRHSSLCNKRDITPSEKQSSARVDRVVFHRRSASSTSKTRSSSSAEYSDDGSSKRIHKHQSIQKPFYFSYAPDPSHNDSRFEVDAAYNQFLREFPQYRNTWLLDVLRKSDYSRLDSQGETYVDYMGGALFPESLVHVHAEFLMQNVLGNTHSVSNSSRLSADRAAEARAAVLAFFDAPPGYTVVFTPNATGAMKLVGESFPFHQGCCYVLGADSHNSLHGIREYAQRCGSGVHYIPSTTTGGFSESEAKKILRQRRSISSPSLFAMTGQSNISNAKNPLSMLSFATTLGYHTLLDAAALAPSSHISLRSIPVDAMAVSFYKMFGYPTGVGALVVKESFLATLSRPWFAGGTVDVVQVPGTIVTRNPVLYEQFEDGTINYLNLVAITDGLRFLSGYLPFIPLRLSCLTNYLVSSLAKLLHDSTGSRVVRVLSRVPSRRVRSPGEQADTGSTISLVFLSPSGTLLPNSFIEHAAVSERISLRTGCMCNPGGAAAILGLQEDMAALYEGVTLSDFEAHVGHELGVVRISLGLASNFQDVWHVLRFARMISTEKDRLALWDAYSASLASHEGTQLSTQ